MEGSAEFNAQSWMNLANVGALHYCRATAPLTAVTQTISLLDIEGDAVGEKETED